MKNCWFLWDFRQNIKGQGRWHPVWRHKWVIFSPDLKICMFKLFAKLFENETKSGWFNEIFSKNTKFWGVWPPLLCQKMAIFSSKSQIMSKYLCLNFLQNFVKIWQKSQIFLRFLIKYQILRCLTPLWRHNMVVFSSKFQNMCLYLCLNFLPNFVKIRRKMTDFL